MNAVKNDTANPARSPARGIALGPLELAATINATPRDASHKPPPPPTAPAAAFDQQLNGAAANGSRLTQPDRISFAAAARAATNCDVRASITANPTVASRQNGAHPARFLPTVGRPKRIVDSAGLCSSRQQSSHLDACVKVAPA